MDVQCTWVGAPPARLLSSFTRGGVEVGDSPSVHVVLVSFYK